MSFFHRMRGIRDKIPKSSSVLSVVHIVYGRPRSGKSYYFAEQIQRSKNSGRQIVTNFQVLGCGAKKFNDKLLHGSYVYDSDIYIDEAYTFFNSRTFKNFTRSMHEFFSLCGHCGNRIYLISQHPARLDRIIREVTTYFVEVSCVLRVPRSGCPILFMRKYYDVDPCEITSEGQKRMVKPVYREWSFFRRSVASVYDCQACRSTEAPLELEPWD